MDHLFLPPDLRTYFCLWPTHTETLRHYIFQYYEETGVFPVHVHVSHSRYVHPRCPKSLGFAPSQDRLRWILGAEDEYGNEEPWTVMIVPAPLKWYQVACH